MSQTEQLFKYDKQYSGIVCGIDEAGRGPLAGPVVCACCSMGSSFIDGINDSKKVSEKKREVLYEKIVQAASYYGIAIIDREIIDDINILNATKLGMVQAYLDMGQAADVVLVDAVDKLDIDSNIVPIIRGDATSYNIAAASILAKVTRDRLMRKYATEYPLYGFEKHKGYGTKVHIEALCMHGSTPIHRKTFIKNFIRSDV